MLYSRKGEGEKAVVGNSVAGHFPVEQLVVSVLINHCDFDRVGRNAVKISRREYTETCQIVAWHGEGLHDFSPAVNLPDNSAIREPNGRSCGAGHLSA